MRDNRFDWSNLDFPRSIPLNWIFRITYSSWVNVRMSCYLTEGHEKVEHD